MLLLEQNIAVFLETPFNQHLHCRLEPCLTHNIKSSKSKDGVGPANHAKRGKLDAMARDHVALVM
jgi:hypothetical protein